MQICYNINMKRCEAIDIIEKLKEIFPDSKCALNYFDAYSLLVAVILSAQCTDKRVNLVTPVFFEKYKNVYELATANENDVSKIIRSCGFYKNKSHNLIECAKKIVKDYNGIVPSSMEDLTSLNGVGRKTANVIRILIYKIPSIPVDTHVFRTANRLMLTSSSNPLNSEKQLMKLLPENYWIDSHFMLIDFGRNICKAQKPNCKICPFANKCKYYKKLLKEGKNGK